MPEKDGNMALKTNRPIWALGIHIKAIRKHWKTIQG